MSNQIGFQTYSYHTEIKLGDRSVSRLWTLRWNTQDEFIVKEVYEQNCYRLPDNLTGKVIIDIGANICAFAAACVDRGAKAVYCYDPMVSPATKLFPAPVVLNPCAVVGENGPPSVGIEETQEHNGTALTGGYNTFSAKSSATARASFSCVRLFEKIFEDHKDESIWIKLDCEGSEYEILASHLPWERIERIFGECHTLIHGRLSRDTAPVDYEDFINRSPMCNIGDLVARLESVGFNVVTEQNPDDPHLSLFWAENDQMRNVKWSEDFLKKHPEVEQQHILVEEYNRNLQVSSDETKAKIDKLILSVSSEDERIIQPDSEYAGSYQGLNTEIRCKCSQCGNPFAYSACGPTHAMIAEEIGIKSVAILTPFRNARRYLSLYFSQLVSLRSLLAQNGYSLRLIAAEGDSLDGTRDRIITLADEHNISLTLVDTTHGHMRWASVEDPVRMRVMSDVMNKALDQVEESDDIVVWLMSDLEWNAETILSLIHKTDNFRHSIYTPMVLVSDNNNSFFYDTWAFRAEGKRFSPIYPFHQILENKSYDLDAPLDSAGTCLVMHRALARCYRASDLEAVSFCNAARKDGHMVLMTSEVVYHAPRATYSILWVSDAVCISGFSRVAHSLFPILSENGIELEIIALNYWGQPHNFPYTIWPANVNGSDESGMSRLQLLLWNNREADKKYDAVVVLDDIWNIPRIRVAIEGVKKAAEREKVEVSIPPVISWVTVDGKNSKREDLDGTYPIAVTEFGRCSAVWFDDRSESGPRFDNVPVIPFGVDSSLFRPMDKAESRAIVIPKEIPADAFIIGYVGTNQLRKNIHGVLEAFATWVYGRVRDIRQPNKETTYLYLCVGQEDSSGCDIESLISYYGLKGKVIINRSLLSDELLVRVYNSFDVFISISFGEGFGLTTLEAMSCGVPCVVSDWSGYSSWIPADCAMKVQCDREVLTAPLNDKSYVIGGVASREKVVDALSKLYQFSDLRNKLSQRGRGLAESMTWERTGQMLVGEIERVVEKEAIKREEAYSDNPASLYYSLDPKVHNPEQGNHVHNRTIGDPLSLLNYQSHTWESRQDTQSGEWQTYCRACGCEDKGNPAEFDLEYPSCFSEVLAEEIPF